MNVVTSIETITPERATVMLGWPRMTVQRNINTRWVSELAIEIESGHFVPHTQIRIGIVSGQRYIIDGQHRLMAVVKSGIPVAFDVLTKNFATIDDMVREYYLIDQGHKRGSVAITRAVIALYDLRLGRYYVDKIGIGGAFMLNGFKSTRQAGMTTSLRGEMQALLSIYLGDEYTEIVKASISKNVERAIVRGPVTSIILTTLTFSRNEAVPFWHAVASMSGDIPQAGKLASHILTTTLGNGQIGQNVSHAYQARYVAGLWNAYHQGRTRISSKDWKAIREQRVISISGSPFDYDTNFTPPEIYDIFQHKLTITA